MPVYEYRKGGRVVERVHARARGHEDTRLGLAAAENKGKDGWHKVEPKPDAGPAEAKPEAGR